MRHELDAFFKPRSVAVIGATPKKLTIGRETLHNIFGPGSLSLLKGTIDSLLADINQQQGRAVAQLNSADPFLVFSFTLPLKEENQTARLKVFYEKKQKAGSKKEFQISLMLSMDRLGDVRTDLTLTGRDLQVAFYVSEPSTKIKIHNNLSKLNELLGPLFENIQLKVNVSQKRVKDFDRFDTFSDDNRRVDVRI